MVDEHGFITSWNRGAEQLFGYSAEEIIGKPCKVLSSNTCTGEFCSSMTAGDCPLFLDRGICSKRCEVHHSSGRKIHVLKNGYPIRDETGHIVAGVETMVDVTALVEAGEEPRKPRQQDEDHPMICSSADMQNVCTLATRAARANMSVQISGESGTGKEVMARFIHRNSDRRDGPFVKVDCPGLSGDLLGSELFGHVRGSFTGANTERRGRFEAAAGGTLFLDEISEISTEHQKKLLRFLQSRAFERVGENRTRRVDVRIIAATNRDLSEEVAAGRFREDLFWRLSAFPIHMPPLRDRMEEVLPLARHFLERHWLQGGTPPDLSAEAEERLASYNWPGNCRELENMMWYATSMVDEDRVVRPGHLPPSIERHFTKDIQPNDLMEALEEAKWNRSKAAEILGISRVTLWRRMKRMGLLDDR